MNIKRIEWMKFIWPATHEGVGVDKETGLSNSEPQADMTDEEAVELSVKFLGEDGELVFPNPEAMRVYSEVWKLLNGAKGKSDTAI
jgi:hypothetical protein